MGEGEAMAPAEEMANAGAAEPVRETDITAKEEVDSSPADALRKASELSPPAAEVVDPWNALLQFGAQFVSALAAAGDTATPAHPWIERDSVSGARSLKLPLPPPETARKIADTLSLLAESLRGKNAAL
jgi:hypothetical protein